MVHILKNNFAIYWRAYLLAVTGFVVHIAFLRQFVEICTHIYRNILHFLKDETCRRKQLLVLCFSLSKFASWLVMKIDFFWVLLLTTRDSENLGLACSFMNVLAVKVGLDRGFLSRSPLFFTVALLHWFFFRPLYLITIFIFVGHLKIFIHESLKKSSQSRQIETCWVIL